MRVLSAAGKSVVVVAAHVEQVTMAMAIGTPNRNGKRQQRGTARSAPCRPVGMLRPAKTTPNFFISDPHFELREVSAARVMD
jgi:hypothetical protein